MPTVRIDSDPPPRGRSGIDANDLDPNERRNFCQHPEHEPPSAQVFKPGLYEHTCPGCGHKGEFVVGVKGKL